MAGPTVDLGTGATLTWSASSYTAEVVSIEHSGKERAVIDTTHLASTARTHMRGDLIEPGEYTLEIHHPPDNPPPIFGTTSQENFVLEFPKYGTQTTGAKETTAGFLYSVDGPKFGIDEKMVTTLKVKLSGAITTAAGA